MVQAKRTGNQRASRGEIFLLMGLALLYSCLRFPLLLMRGRVICEEGTVYLQDAWNHTFLQTLLALHQGYYSLVMNLLAFMTARVLPLEWAGLVMTWTAVAIMMLSVFLAITCEAFNNQRARALAAAICLLTPAIESWPIAEDSQFVLILATALVCISVSTRFRVVRSLTLLFAGLTGPASCVLTPFFLIRAYRERSRWSYAQALIMVSCSLVSGSITLRTLRMGVRGFGEEGKTFWFGPILFVKIFAFDLFTRVGVKLTQAILTAHQTRVVGLLFWILTFACVALFWLMARLGGNAAKLCFYMAIASLVFNYAGIQEPVPTIFVGAYRYFFAGLDLFGFTIVLADQAARQRGNSRQRRITLVMICLLIGSGLIDAVGYWHFSQFTDPPWRNQVAQWRLNPAYPLQVSPSFWPARVHLSAR